MNFLGRLFPSTKRPTVEEMLAVLDGVGIRLRSGIGVQDLFAGAARDEIERGGYESLLLRMGDSLDSEGSDEKWYEKGSETRFSDDVWYFNNEAIEGPGSYTWIIHNLSALTGGSVAFDSVRDHVDDEAEVAWADVARGGKTERLTFKFNRDWADPRILDWFQEALSNSGSSRQFAKYNLGQDDLVICKTREEIAAINTATGLGFSVV
jgi:hypothetical protein